ncbi:protein-L-isoaspartate O-methyltransferase family protein [Thermanaerovibrio velox]|uniref:protein-L-isoaspartate O-methyltransferase family protein n=1 Tax=Thermanaerovibrio velox TaxID=108007 RepID=UPI0005930573|nr:protein-L-isoaspartate O-methyltransferase [Thermanaerovibrio velox]
MAEQVKVLGCGDPDVISAIREIPRHRFIEVLREGAEEGDRRALEQAYGDFPFPIGFGQTVSQPSMVARMTHLLSVRSGIRVLEVGSGCGYQCAVLGRMGCVVTGVERIGRLVDWSRRVLGELGLSVEVVHGDGLDPSLGLGRFPRVLISAACSKEDVERAFGGLLSDPGILVAPVDVGGGMQRVLVVNLEGGERGERWEDLCRFVPLVGGLAKD